MDVRHQLAAQASGASPHRGSERWAAWTEWQAEPIEPTQRWTIAREASPWHGEDAERSAERTAHAMGEAGIR